MNALCVLGVGLLLITGQAPPRLIPEPPPVASGTASIEGRVIDAASEKPIEGVEVRLSESHLTVAKEVTSRRSMPRTSKAKTDRDGHFAFRDVAAGPYQLMAIDKRYLPGCFGATRQSPGPCVELDVLADQARQGADFYLSRAGMITGRLVDHDGQPLAQTGVRAMPVDGDLAHGGIPGWSEADGRFEVGGLMPGSVILVVELPSTGGSGLYRVFYPGVLNQRDAQPIAIDSDTTIDVEIRVPKLTTASIDAQVYGPAGFKLDKLTLVELETRKLVYLNEPGPITSLRGGRYVIEARASAGEKSLAAFAIVDLQADDVEVPLQLEPAGHIEGRVVAERGGVPPLNGVRVAAVWMRDGIELDPIGSDAVSVAPNGLFSIDSLFGYRQFRVVGLPAGWHVTAIRAGRSDITSSGLDVAPGSGTELTIVVARR